MVTLPTANTKTSHNSMLTIQAVTLQPAAMSNTDDAASSTGVKRLNGEQLQTINPYTTNNSKAYLSGGQVIAEARRSMSSVELKANKNAAMSGQREGPTTLSHSQTIERYTMVVAKNSRNSFNNKSVEALGSNPLDDLDESHEKLTALKSKLP